MFNATNIFMVNIIWIQFLFPRMCFTTQNVVYDGPFFLERQQKRGSCDQKTVVTRIISPMYTEEVHSHCIHRVVVR